MRYQRVCRGFSAWKLLFIICAVTVIYNELLSYFFPTLTWPPILKTRDGMTLLLVGDPQIVGYDGESKIWGPITRWDNYHYLWLTFALAFRHVSPDLVLFLGDLIDEGSTSTDPVYQEYVRTFTNIYRSNVPYNKLYVPGDNDVGGEGSDPRTKAKDDRFSDYFGKTPTVQHEKFINFVKLSNEMVEDTESTVVQRLSRELHPGLTVMVNHQPILPYFRMQYLSVLKELNPGLIISAHTHSARLMSCGGCSGPRPDLAMVRMPRVGGTFHVRASRENRTLPLIELVSPTCSYRMGETDMAFTVVQIERSGHVTYSFLWLPRRLSILKMYLIPLASSFLISVYKLLVYAVHDRKYRKMHYHSYHP